MGISKGNWKPYFSSIAFKASTNDDEEKESESESDEDSMEEEWTNKDANIPWLRRNMNMR